MTREEPGAARVTGAPPRSFIFCDIIRHLNNFHMPEREKAKSSFERGEQASELNSSVKYHWLDKGDIHNLSKRADTMADYIASLILKRYPNLPNSTDAKEIVQTFIREGLTNAVLHGLYDEYGEKGPAIARAEAKHNANPGIYQAMLVRTDLEMSDLGFKISIEDEGKGFKASDVPDPTREENLLKPHGRGIHNINGFAKLFGYEFSIINLGEIEGSTRHGTRITLENKFNIKPA